MDSVKLPKFSGERRDFDVWKKRFRAFGMMQKCAPALSSDNAASSQQQVDMYSTLILALPEDDLSIIENISEDDKTCGHTAWTALVNHFENDGIHRCTELLQDLETPQADGESGIQYMNRVVRLQRQLARVGDFVHDRRIIMYLVKGLRSEYHSITDTCTISAWIPSSVIFVKTACASRDVRNHIQRSLPRLRLLQRLMMTQRQIFSSGKSPSSKTN
jgi:hypothetical protein